MARFAIFGLLSMVLVILDISGIDRIARRWIDVPVVAAKATTYGVLSAARFLSVWRVKDQEINRLNEELSVANSLAAQAATLSAENVALKTQLGTKLAPVSRLLMASPIGLAGGEMTISAGSAQGVAVGETVVLGQVLVGKVVAVSPGQSRVRLPVYDGEKIAAAVRSGGVDGVRKASGIVTNTGGQLILDKVTLSEPLTTGDLVLTVGDGYARDQLIGKIGEILERENDLFKSARVEPATDYARLDRVFVILST